MSKNAAKDHDSTVDPDLPGDKKWDEMSEEEKQELIRKQEAIRQVLDRISKNLKMYHFRVTDSKFNSHITLPKALHQDQEVYINLRRTRWTARKIEYFRRLEKNRMKMNLKKKQLKGYRKLTKRLKNKEFKMCQTDKSNRLVPVPNDVYLEMGKEHTEKDKECTMEEALAIIKCLDAHSSMLIKILNQGRGNEN